METGWNDSQCNDENVVSVGELTEVGHGQQEVEDGARNHQDHDQRDDATHSRHSSSRSINK